MKVFWFLFVFVIAQLSATGSVNDNLFPVKNPIFVSLGNKCWTAQALQLYQLRECAFPFDWLFTLDDDGLNRALDEDFECFTDKDYFSPHDYHPVAVENTHYGMIFTHDWPFSDLELTEERYHQHLEAIKIKYQRRIERFRKLRDYKGKVFFFRTFSTHCDIVGDYGWNAEKVKKLKASLDRYFPHLDFTLIILSCSEPDISEVGEVEGVREFKIRELYVQENYLNMFTELLSGERYDLEIQKTK